MLWLALVFLVIAILCYILGSRGVLGGEVGTVLAIVFLVFCVITLFGGFFWPARGPY